MKMIWAAVALAATGLLGSSGAGSAATFPVSGTQYNSPTESGAFSDTYTFTLTSASDIYATFSGDGGLVQSIGDISFGIYQGATERLAGSIIRQGKALTGSTDIGTLDAGSYTIEVKDTYSGASGTYNGNLTLSAVPLPTSVALFGMSVFALGVAGAVRRKGRKASAAA